MKNLLVMLDSPVDWGITYLAPQGFSLRRKKNQYEYRPYVCWMSLNRKEQRLERTQHPTSTIGGGGQWKQPYCAYFYLVHMGGTRLGNRARAHVARVINSAKLASGGSTSRSCAAKGASIASKHLDNVTAITTTCPPIYPCDLVANLVSQKHNNVGVRFQSERV